MAKAGQITVDLQMGTAKMIVDLENAKGKLREFGQAGQASARVVNAEMRLLEGNITNNNRAAAAFLLQFPALGKAAAAAFPVLGAVAFAGVVGEAVTKVRDFFKELHDGPQKVNTAFRELGSSIRSTNDELAVSNARLENDIAKLEGKRENTLALALAEAREAADKFAQSLDQDLEKLHKVLEENNAGFWKGFIGGLAPTDDLVSGIKGFREKIGGITDQGTDQLEKATTQKAKDAAQTQLNTQLLKAYRDELTALDTTIANRKSAQQTAAEGEYTGGDVDYGPAISQAVQARRQLAYELAGISARAQNQSLTEKKGKLDADSEAANATKPFQDRLKALAAQIDEVKAKLEAIGKPEAAQILAKAFGESQKAITEVNKELEKHHKSLTDLQKDQIRAAELTLVGKEAETEWQSKFVAASTSINERIKAQRDLTAAIGAGYEATKAANVEARLAQELGQHYNDPAWMSAHAPQVNKLRTGFGEEQDAQHGTQVGNALDAIDQQIKLEGELARVQSQGAEAIRQVTLAYKLKDIALHNDEESAKALMAAEIKLYAAGRATAVSGEVAKINEAADATERLTAATLKGADAIRQARLENELIKIQSEGDAPIPGMIGIGQRGVAAIGADKSDHSLQVAQAAASANRVQQLNDELAKLKEARDTLGDTLAVELKIRDVENQRIDALVQQELQLNSISAGFDAFFLNLEKNADTAAKVIYNGLTSALNDVSNDLANMATGMNKPKGGWGQMWGTTFKGVGHQMVQESFKSALGGGMGAAAKKLGLDPAKAQAKFVKLAGPDGSSTNPFFVVAQNPPQQQQQGDGTQQPVQMPSPGAGKLFGAGGIGKVFSMFGFGGGGASGAGGGGSADSSITYGGIAPSPGGGDSDSGSLWDSISNSIPFLAGGGDVDPGRAYVVGDGGDGSGAELFSPKTAGTITPLSKLGGGDTTHNHYYNIDARGAELGVESRVRAQIEAAHASAVAQSLRAQHERASRTPQKRGG